jgi:EAL domain-containing protein (putative c-di-GMP-specific phosphodiesterase class I)
VADVTNVSLLAGSVPDRVTITARPELGLDGEPHLVFQPAVDLATGRLLGFEALLRWEDPARRSIPPVVLIPWAEARGQMSRLNAWVLSEACAQAARWPLTLQVAVNCSVFQLRRAEVASAAVSALEESGLNPDRLTIEVTETTIADERAAADLDAMARLGIQVAVDDIESADCSLLANLPESVVNTIKIDGTLIRDLDTPQRPSRAIVETIVKLSRSLGICTVAEAVETAEQVAILRKIGVDVAQGYFFSLPLAAEEAYALASAKFPPSFAVVATSGEQAEKATHQESFAGDNDTQRSTGRGRFSWAGVHRRSRKK